MVRLIDSPTQNLEFRPVDRDTFQRGMMTVRFHRDKAGSVVAFDFSNPVLRELETEQATAVQTGAGRW